MLGRPERAKPDEIAIAHVMNRVAPIFARLHIDAERWQSLLRPGKLVGQYFGRLHNLCEMAARRGKRWVKNHAPEPQCSPSDRRSPVYDPFCTALREATEECLGLLRPAPTPDDVSFFGLGRWMKTRFPFLFGEIRLKHATLKEVLSYEPTQRWEGERLAIPFTVEAVTRWCADRYQDQYFGRASWPVSSPIFSLLQSLPYAYPDQWPPMAPGHPPSRSARDPEPNRRITLDCGGSTPICGSLSAFSASLVSRFL